MEPDGVHALVTDFEGGNLYRIDLTDPATPALVGNVNIGIPAEDIAVDPTGSYAVVTDGGWAFPIAIIALPSLAFITQNLPNGGAQAVDIASDGTVVVVHTYTGQLTIGMIDPSDPLTAGMTDLETINGDLYPVNATISPDGMTLLISRVVISGPGFIDAYDLGTRTLTGSIEFPDWTQSAAFSPDGSRIFATTRTEDFHMSFSWLQMTGPNTIGVGEFEVADLGGGFSGAKFGVDKLAADSHYAFVTNEDESDGFPSTEVVQVDLTDWSTTAVDTGIVRIFSGDPVITVTDTVAPTDDLGVPFGDLTSGTTSATETVTITNTGDTDLEIGTITLDGGDTADFAITVDGCSNTAVAPAGSCDVTVAFMPVYSCALSTDLLIPSNGIYASETRVALSGTAYLIDTLGQDFEIAPSGNIHFQSKLNRFRQVEPAPRLIEVENTSSSSITIDDVTLFGPNTSGFQTTFGITMTWGTPCGELPFVLAPYQSCYFSTSFDPENADLGRNEASVLINADGICTKKDLVGYRWQ